MKIPANIIPDAYNISKEIYLEKYKRFEGINFLEERGLNKNSAADYIDDLRFLLDAKEFQRTLNTSSMDYFMENIFKDFGITGIRNALIALEAHIVYYEGIRKVTMRSMRNIVLKYTNLLTAKSFDNIIEQDEIAVLIKKSKSREQVILELKDLKEIDPEIVTINHKTYKRDNKTIAQIKFIRDYKCQICNSRILKRNGSYYIEAAHIIPKYKIGRETPDNIILLCPNHHKEFDFGNLQISSHTLNNIEFTLNDVRYNVNLTIE